MFVEFTRNFTLRACLSGRRLRRSASDVKRFADSTRGFAPGFGRNFDVAGTYRRRISLSLWPRRRCAVAFVKFVNPGLVEPRIGRDVSELSDDDIDYLLSQGRLGRAHKERLLRRVLASIPSPPVTVHRPSRRRWQVLGVLPLACAAVILALWWRPAVEKGSTLRAKGTPALAPVVGMSCLGGSVRACPSGSRIVLWLEGGTQETGFITAYADPVGGGERVWYLTNEPASNASSTRPNLLASFPKPQ